MMLRYWIMAGVIGVSLIALQIVLVSQLNEIGRKLEAVPSEVHRLLKEKPAG